jgi:hypothetical protein
MIPAKDISKYQGNWQDTGEPIVLIKMSGGDAGLYMDTQAANNYGAAVNDGRAVGGYHFIGWTLGAIAEATYFLQAMSPVAENDVYALDIEAIKNPNPVAYVTEMVDFIHSKVNLYPLLYMNLSVLRAYDWSALLKNCGLWLADWAVSPNSTIPNIPIYVMQQYSDGPNYDHDEWFGSIDEFKMYGYHKPVQEVPSVPTQDVPPIQAQPSQPTVTPSAPEDPHVVIPQAVPQVQTPPTEAKEPVKVIVPEPTYFRLWDLVLAIIKKLLGKR